MAKYLYEGCYTEQGLKGLMKEGGSSRRQVVEAMLKELGGKLEAFYYAFGDNDVYCIVDVPDHVTTAAVIFAVNASGAAKLKTTVLLTPEDVDQATKESVHYRPPAK